MPNVLIACEESQTIAKAFRKIGINAFSCDLQECSGGRPDIHFNFDVKILLDLDFLLNGYPFITSTGDMYRFSDTWDLLIAHPPCTFLSNAGASHLYPKGQLNQFRYEQGVKAAEFFYFFLNTQAAKRVCVENPKPLSIFGLPGCSQIIQPYMFGEPFYKTTYLWLRRLPILFATSLVVPEDYWLPNGSKSNGVAGHNSRLRSKTFTGVAAAMVSQWSDFL